MPSWLRRYTFHKIQKYFDDQNKEIEKANKGKKVPSKNSNIVKRPTYSTKVNK